MNKIHIEKERMIDGTGWLTHILAVKVGMCEKSEHCPDNAEEDLIDFLWALMRFTDGKPITIADIEIKLIFNEHWDQTKLSLIYEDKEVII